MPISWFDLILLGGVAAACLYVIVLVAAENRNGKKRAEKYLEDRFLEIFGLSHLPEGKASWHPSIQWKVDLVLAGLLAADEQALEEVDLAISERRSLNPLGTNLGDAKSYLHQLRQWQQKVKDVQARRHQTTQELLEARRLAKRLGFNPQMGMGSTQGNRTHFKERFSSPYQGV